MRLHALVLCGLLFAATPTFGSGRPPSRSHRHATAVDHPISSARLKRWKSHRLHRADKPAEAPQAQTALSVPPSATSLVRLKASNSEPADVWASPLPDSTLDQSVNPSGAAPRADGPVPETIRSFAQPANQAGAPNFVLPVPEIVRPPVGR